MTRPALARKDGAPHISVVIPTYNRAALVVRAVESAMGQLRPADEIVVVDDGSTDDTRERLAAMAGDGLRVVSQANGGAAAARNRGVAEATGRWVAFLDSDDVWVPQHLERVAAAIEETSGIAQLYFADTSFAREDGTPTSFWREAGFAIAKPHELVSDATPWVSRAVHPMLLQASVVSRSRFLESGGFWTGLTLREDTHFFLRICLGGSACAVADAGTQMTDDANDGRLTRIHSPETAVYWHDTVRVYQDILAHHPGLSPEVRRVLRGRLSIGHWRLARQLLAEGRRRDGARALGRALLARPREVPEHLTRRLAQRFADFRRR